MARLVSWLSQHAGQAYHVRPQLPLVVGESSVPEPDLALVEGDVWERTHHPTTAALVIEVSDASVRLDRGVKLRLYAAAGVPEYWILDLVARRLEVYREPRPASQTEATRYTVRRVVEEAGSVAPEALPEAKIQLSRLLSLPGTTTAD